MEAVQNFFQTLTRMGWSDYLDIIVVAFLIYSFLPLLKNHNVMKIVRTVVLLVLVTWITDEMQLYTLNWLLNQILAIGLLAFIVLFQPELRRVLFMLTGKKWFGIGKPVNEMDQVIRDTVEASGIMSIGKKAYEQLKNARKAAEKGTGTEEKDAPAVEAPAVEKKAGSNDNKDLLMDGKVGALIVFEGKTPLDEYIAHGTQMNCQVSVKTLCSIFYPVSPLHDGAVIIRNGRIAAAGCKLPLTENEEYRSKYGTRHCAAIGVTENGSDAVAVVVSEERGEITYTKGGRPYLCIKGEKSAIDMLDDYLRRDLLPKEDETGDNEIVHTLKKLFGLDKEESKNER